MDSAGAANRDYLKSYRFITSIWYSLFLTFQLTIYKSMKLSNIYEKSANEDCAIRLQ
jgi:hypothetical protein